MHRSKFPYSARSSAKVLRHAVSIDERRAKFRSDLMTNSKKKTDHVLRLRGRTDTSKSGKAANDNKMNGHAKSNPEGPDRFRMRRPSRVNLGRSVSPQMRASVVEKGLLDTSGNLMARSRTPSRDASDHREDRESVRSCASSYLPPQIPTEEEDEEDEATPQDIEELWFPGGHGDLGGGWVLKKDETPLSLVPLVWMVREAQRAGLEFDGEQMLALKCCDDNLSMEDDIPADVPKITTERPPMPEIQITGSSTNDIFNSPRREKEEPGWAAGLQPAELPKSNFKKTLEHAMTKSILHDVLLFHNGLSTGQVLAWKCMEYLPFRRMDLQPDGSWKAISLPLPMGETRDIPDNARIHHSAILRMKADENYRPGNLIIGGGGRGVRKAPKEMGIGNWEVFKGEGDQIGCVYVRKGESMEKKIGRGEQPQMEENIHHQIHEERKHGALLTTAGT